MKVLFICSQNLNRSKTAEEIFKNRFETKSAGMYNENPVTQEEISWADVIVVMEDIHRTELAARFPRQYLKKRVVTLDIPDIYTYNSPELIEVLKSKVSRLL